MSTPKPFVSDEQVNETRAMFKKLKALSYDEYVAEFFAEGHTHGSVWMRSLYEPHVQQLVRERDEALAKVEWISVEDRLPEGYQWVLVYGDTGDIGDFPFDIGRIIGGEWKCLGWDYPVTHWTPLPLSPNTPPSNG